MSETSAAAIVIGASAGAVQALSRILPLLPSDYPIPVLVVVHVPPEGSSIAPLFHAKCQLRVKEAEDKEPILSGAIYFAPSNYHLLVEPDRSISLSVDEPVLYSRPSIDVLFESAADTFGEELVGAVLTGANEDGAQGLRAIVDAGGIALVEAPETAFAKAMPYAASLRSPEAKQMQIDDMGAYLLRLGSS